MSNMETKLRLREAIKRHCEEEDIYYREVDNTRILTRCPCCGDSTNPSHAHFYLIIDPNSNTNAGYICFKCGEHGPVTADILEAMGIDDSTLMSGISRLNKTADKMSTKGYMEEKKMLHFDFEIPYITQRDAKIAYLENRMGRKFTTSELKDAKVITSLKHFLMLNNIQYRPFQPYLIDMLERDFIGFLSFGNSHLLLRDITDTHDPSWVKYPILEESRANRVLYTISNSLDPLSTDTFTINLSEGIMDTLSVAYNLDHANDNELNVCLCGKQYKSFLRFLLDLGFCGSNIYINIFADNDMEFNLKAKEVTDLAYFKKNIGRFKYIFGKITIYYNRKQKDCGVPKDEIRLVKHVL